MKIIFFIFFLSNGYYFAQTCVFDGKVMNSLGVSELVNSENLSLFRCSEGHQMWLTDDEITPSKISTNIIKKMDNPDNIEVNSKNEKDNEAFLLSNHAESADISVFEDQKIVKSETVLKRETLSLNLSNNLNIEKFGIETLLYNKLESDRAFAKILEEERSELLHMMYKQSKLFESINDSKFSFKKLNLFSRAKVYYIYLPLILTYYISI